MSDIATLIGRAWVLGCLGAVLWVAWSVRQGNRKVKQARKLVRLDDVRRARTAALPHHIDREVT